MHISKDLHLLDESNHATHNFTEYVNVQHFGLTTLPWGYFQINVSVKSEVHWLLLNEMYRH